MKIMISCEHGGNLIPPDYEHLFASPAALADLDSHRGYDYGAMRLFELICDASRPDFAHAARTSRLLIDLNRSLDAPSLFSEYSVGVSADVRQRIIDDVYLPYRQAFIAASQPWFAAGERVVHLSVHSFTPIFGAQVRNADIGILYDPAMAAERCLAAKVKSHIARLLPHLRVRFNYPYLGKTDGHVVWYRRRHPEAYAGIEFEMGYNCAYPEVERKLAEAVARACKLFEVSGL